MSLDPLARVRARPSASDWGLDDAITLAEAVALFFPAGPLTIRSFRSAAKSGRLAVCRISGKDFTTPRSVQEMLKPCLVPQKARVSTSGLAPAARPSTSSSTQDALRSAQAAALKTVRELRENSRNTSRGSTRRP